MRRVILAFLVIFISPLSQAQQFGGFPPSMRWRQINTDTARIIFPAGADADAQRTAAIVHRLQSANPFGGRDQKISIVLHPFSTLSNGYVGLGPFRSEYYLIPPSDPFQFGNLSWTDNLAIHEWRHVQQYNHLNRGLSRVGGVLFGQEGRALFNALSVPDWWFEGDAVWAETALTNGGRGRLPLFLNGYAALWKEGREYNWMKLRNGSLKDFVPNHYPLGYLLVNYGYAKYGADFWQKVGADAAGFRGGLYPFQKAVRRYSGVSFQQFQREAFDHYRQRTSQKRDMGRSRQVVTQYQYPTVSDGGEVVVLKNSFKQIPHFVTRSNGKEQRIAQQHISTDDWFSLRGDTIAYTAFSTHPRWSLLNYSDVVLQDVRTGKSKRITRRARFYNPDIDPSGNKIVALKYGDSLQTHLVVMDLSGTEIFSVPAGEGTLRIQPRWLDTSRVVHATRLPNGLSQLEITNLKNGSVESLLPPTPAIIGHLRVRGDWVYFTSSLAGQDNVYRVHTSRRTVQQLTTGGTGHYFPDADGDSLIYAAFTSNGYELQGAPIDGAALSLPAQQWTTTTAPFAPKDSGQQSIPLTLYDRTFEQKKYSQSTGLFNFHSYRPDYDDPEVSFRLYGNNVLNTVRTEAGYTYNINELSHNLRLSVAYAGLFPVINATVSNTFDRHFRTTNGTFTFNTSEVQVGASIPLNLTQGKWLRGMNLGLNGVLNRTAPTGAAKDRFRTTQATYLHGYLGYSQQKPLAVQYIYSRLGTALNASYRQRLDDDGYQTNIGAAVLLPGIGLTHSLVLQGAFQQTDTGNIIFSNRFANSRGYRDYFLSRMWKLGANYHMPLLYPDRGVGNIVYLLRVRSNVFYDYGRVYARDRTTFRNQRSAGGEVFFETKWWNSYRVTIGIRYSRLLDRELAGGHNPNRWDIVLPLDLIPD